MEKNTLVSIILPVYNGEKYLSESVESCLNQTYKNIELIIVNDCSTDATLQIANEFASTDKRVKVVTNKINKRLPASLNIGHNLATGNMLTWTSDDNLYLSNAIEVMVSTIVNRNADFVYTNFIQIDENSNELRTFYLEEPQELLWRNVVGACFLYKKNVYKNNKGYNEELFMVEDYDFWLRAFMKHKFIHINKILYKYRVHSQSLTNEINIVNSEKQLIFVNNKYKMYSSVFNEYKFPNELQKLIIHFQKTNTVNSETLIKNIEQIKQFYITIFDLSDYKKHLFYLKDKYIKGVRKSRSTQGFIPFIKLIYFFNKVMVFNDYKTALKIVSHKFLNK